MRTSIHPARVAAIAAAFHAAGLDPRLLVNRGGAAICVAIAKARGLDKA